MQVQVNTDHNIEGRTAMTAKVREVIESALTRTSNRITRVEVHLSDMNGDKNSENDKRCVMEARLEGRRPIAVTHRAATLDQAVDGAVAKLSRLIENTIGWLRDKGNHMNDPHLPETDFTEE